MCHNLTTGFDTMVYRFVSFTGAVLLFSSPVMSASNNADAVWNGSVNRSCSINALQDGKVKLNGKTGNQSRLDSTASGGAPAIISYTVVGADPNNPARIGFARNGGSVTRNGTELLNGGDFRELEINVANRGWVRVYQNTHNNTYNNQKDWDRAEIKTQGSGQVSVEARTNAHLAQNGSIVPGDYVVTTTMECIF